MPKSLYFCHHNPINNKSPRRPNKEWNIWELVDFVIQKLSDQVRKFTSKQSVFSNTIDFIYKRGFLGPKNRSCARVFNLNNHAHNPIRKLPIWYGDTFLFNRRNALSSVAIYVLLFSSSCTTYYKIALIDPFVNSQLTQELLEIEQRDQLYYWQLVVGEPNMAVLDSLSKLPVAQQPLHIKYRSYPDYKLTDEQYDSLQKVRDFWKGVDQERFLQIYNSYGWPGKVLKETAPEYVSSIMLQFPDSVKLLLYSQLKKEFMSGDVSGADIAAMYDKYLLDHKKPLLYGMFPNFDTVTKTSLPPVIRDIKTTNKARKELGLPPLVQYSLAGKKNSS